MSTTECTIRMRLLVPSSGGACCCALAVLLALAGGCSQQMNNQARLDPLEENAFFDGSSSREWVPGTVARGDSPHELVSYSEQFLTGVAPGQQLVAALPEEITEQWTTGQLLARGQERYAIFCVHCHDPQGDGQGIVPQRGFPEPPTYHSQRLRAVPLGHIYRVISYGRGQMPAHGGQIPPADRWAIAAYVRALQLSQHVEADRLTAEETEQLRSTSATEAP